MANIPPSVVSAELEDLLTGSRWPLTVRSGSGCHFTERFSHGSWEIALRVDWSDLDANGDPCLDADFFRPGSSRPDKTMKLHTSHHTRKSLHTDGRLLVYAFQYEGLALSFLLRLARVGDATGSAALVDKDARTEVDD